MTVEAPVKIASVFIELTNHCNHHCTFCPSDWLKRPRGRMSPELFRSICDQLSRDKLADSVSFHLMGEPFIHKNIFDFLAYTEQVGLKVVLVTNASLITDKNADRLFDNLNGSLICSMQTPDAETFQYRGVKNQTFEQYRDQIRNVVRHYLRRTRGVIGKNYVEIHLLNTKHCRPGVSILDQDDVARASVEDWWHYVREVEQELGLDFSVHELPQLDYLLQPTWHGHHFEVAPGVLVRFKGAGTFANSRIGEENVVIPTTEGYCPNPFNMLGILWNGHCTLCCVDHDGEIRIGDANEKPLKEIWLGPEAETIRDGFRNNQVVNSFCQHCLGEVVPQSEAPARLAAKPEPIQLFLEKPTIPEPQPEPVLAGAAGSKSVSDLMREALQHYQSGGVGTVAKYSAGFVAKQVKKVVKS